MSEWSIRVLGPLQIFVDGRPASTGGRIRRALLGRLVLAHGQPVTAGRLVDDIWEGAPPATAAAVLQVQVHNLRRVLEPDRPPRVPAGVLVSEPGGYALRLPAAAVDAWEFEALLHDYEQAVRDTLNSPDSETRCRLLDAALARWHGRPYAAFEDAPWAAAESARLADLRLLAAELRADAALDLERPAEVLTGLHRTAAEHPEREETARLLATAQYRLGQQTEALATLRRTRDYLRNDLAVDPGPRLQALESAILNQDPALTAGRSDAHSLVTGRRRPRPTDPEPAAHEKHSPPAAETVARAAGYVAAAARTGIGASAEIDSIRLWQTAIDLHELAGHAARDAEHGRRVELSEARCELVAALAGAGRSEAARRARTAAVESAVELGERELVVRALTSWRAPVAWPLRDRLRPDAAIEHALADALGTAENQWERVALRTAMVFEADPLGPQPVLEWAREAVGGAAGDPVLHCGALNALAAVLLERGAWTELPDVAGELERAAILAGRTDYLALAHYLHLRIACAGADLTEAMRQQRLAAAFADAAGSGVLTPALDSFTAATVLLGGDPDGAEQLYRDRDEQAGALGAPNRGEFRLLGRVAVDWARGDLSGRVDELAAASRALPGDLTHIYTMSLLHAGEIARAAVSFEIDGTLDPARGTAVGTVFRAHAALVLGEPGELRVLFHRLRPYAGTVAGAETGTVVFGPVDELLADLAAALGNSAIASRYRTAATELMARIRSVTIAGP
ncbi:BTAD domain-containing putative transcriptional regulator [Nocardia yamanashiensis]|uniref:BTAD domain-containing putative transcriptional regulator n=1 Tax=Nocardia yamanashiensis TaxID=209247 RepID=UPI0008368977|nr:BTAD domain-containing putative transcriptional regulator [Nocardia yamanashiensis]